MGMGRVEVHRHGSCTLSQNARKIADRLWIGQDVGIEDFLRHHQDKTAVAGNHVGNDAIPSVQGHGAKNIARYFKNFDAIAEEMLLDLED